VEDINHGYREHCLRVSEPATPLPAGSESLTFEPVFLATDLASFLFWKILIAATYAHSFTVELVPAPFLFFFASITTREAFLVSALLLELFFQLCGLCHGEQTRAPSSITAEQVHERGTKFFSTPSFVPWQ